MSVFVGIDVSKASLDVGTWPSKKSWKVANADEDFEKLSSELLELEAELVVIESTGGYEKRVAAVLAAAGLEVRVVNPRGVRDFAKATGALAKTDRLDALVLAHFGAAMRPEKRPLKPEETALLQDLLSRRRQLVEMLSSEKNRLHSASHKKICTEIKAHIRWLEKRIEKADSDLDEAIKSSPIWSERNALLQSMPGIGRVSALTLMALLPELGELSKKEVAAIVGVAPFARDSGTLRGKRTCWGGRAGVRAVLYMGALAAVRSEGPLRSFYKRLTGAGKPHKVAMTACMRKMVVALNAMAKANRKWVDPRLSA